MPAAPRRLTAREESVMLVVSQYLGSQRAAADVQAAQSRVSLAQALYDQAADLQKNGVGTGIDTLRANVELQNEKQRLIVARTQLETSLFGLARLLNVDPHRTIELADQAAFFDTPEIAADQTALTSNGPRLQPPAPSCASCSPRSSAPRSSSRPPPTSASPSSRSAASGSSRASPPAPSFRSISTRPVSISRSSPAAASRPQRAQADLAIRQLKQQEQDLRNRIALEVKTAIAQVEAARSEVTVANLGVDLARQEVEQARDRFQAGVANNIEVVTAQDALAAPTTTRSPPSTATTRPAPIWPTPPARWSRSMPGDGRRRIPSTPPSTHGSSP